MIILCKKYSMCVTGLFKVLYDIIQHEFENSYFFFLLHCSHFVIATTKTQKNVLKNWHQDFSISAYTCGHQ